MRGRYLYITVETGNFHHRAIGIPAPQCGGSDPSTRFNRG